ncbi:MAG TPA: hypothetical protein VGM95_01170 [Lactobacillaceae bacterium]|jgi:uncharacterized membrane-anchored protein
MEQTIKDDILELQHNLTPENKAYFEQFTQALRLRGWYKSKQQIDELLLQVISDLLEAQQHAQSAESYLGAQPQVLVAELLRNMKTSWREAGILTAGFVMLMVMLLAGNSLISSLAGYPFTWYWPAIGVALFVQIGFFWLGIWLEGRLSFQPKLLKLVKWATALLGLIIAVLLYQHLIQ